MRALFVCPNLNSGGAERHWSILLPALSGLGIGVSLATLDGRGEFYSVIEQAGIPSTCFADRGRLGVVAALRSLRGTDADVIVTRATSADGLGMLATRGRSARWIVNWHRAGGLPLSPRRVLILRRILPFADAVLAVSESQVPELLSFGVRRESIHVIHNGTDLPDARAARGRTREELGLSVDDVAVLFAGRLDQPKRADVFIESLALAQREHPALVGLIAGGGPLESDLRRQAQQTGANVRFLGRRDDMPQVIAASDVLALTSDREALPYVILESMAGGLPIVSTRVGAVPEVVTPETGITVAPGDAPAFAEALGRLAADSELRAGLGAAGRARQQHLYSAEAMCQSYADTMWRVADGASRAP